MNLPKGPDTLCFDKDEFMKVRAGAALPEPRRVARLPFPPGPPRAALAGSWAAHAPDQPPAGPRCLRSESFGLRCGRGSLL